MSLNQTQRRWAFSALIMATVIAVLDISAINLALPTIAGDLGLAISDALWLSKANLLACSIAILPCAAIGDVVGHRRVFSAGLLTFAFTATGCTLSSDLGLLIILRALQGCASAAIMCSSLVLLREIFPAKMLGAALGVNALFVAVATTTGPAISGLILTFLSWRWLFAMSPFLALTALLLGLAHLPEKKSLDSRFDWLGTLLLIGTASVLLSWYLRPDSPWLAFIALVIGGAFFSVSTPGPLPNSAIEPVPQRAIRLCPVAISRRVRRAKLRLHRPAAGFPARDEVQSAGGSRFIHCVAIHDCHYRTVGWKTRRQWQPACGSLRRHCFFCIGPRGTREPSSECPDPGHHVADRYLRNRLRPVSVPK